MGGSDNHASATLTASRLKTGTRDEVRSHGLAHLVGTRWGRGGTRCLERDIWCPLLLREVGPHEDVHEGAPCALADLDVALDLEPFDGVVG